MLNYQRVTCFLTVFLPWWSCWCLNPPAWDVHGLHHGFFGKEKLLQIQADFETRREEKTQQLRQELERTQQIRCTDDLGSIFWVWVNTYRYIFSGMNIHLPAILMFTRGTRFWHTAILLGSYDRIYSSYMLVGGFKHDWIMFYFIYGMSSQPHWRTHIFQDG